MSDPGYRLLTYRTAQGDARAGIAVDDTLLDVEELLAADGLPGVSTTLDCLRDWDAIDARLARAAAACRAGTVLGRRGSLAEARLAAPVLHPGAVFCAGANYRDHVAEMSRALGLPPEPDPHAAGLAPWHFQKAPRACIRATGETVPLPAYSTKVDWEAEIAAVIGRRARNVPVAAALDYVAGYSIVNDLSARDHIRRAGVAVDSPFHFDWVSHKCFDGALPFGPWLTPARQLGDPGALSIRLWVDDELMQDSSSAQMIHSIAEQIAHLSTRVTLEPGDLIATGTPAGVGAARGRFLRGGDVCRIEIERIGTLTTRFS